MHLRISRTVRNGKTFEYVQIVVSERRADGMPVHRVLGTLGTLPALEVDNLRAAIAASREKRRVVVAPFARVSATQLPDIVANLRYLDVAVPLELWRQWSLPELLEGLMPTGDAEVPPASIVAALVMQRLVDPGSKLAATEWFPRSALPELLDVAPSRFNNTRIHRVLELLDAAGLELQAKLPRRYQDKEGAFASLFLDVTDAMFVGHGPSYAARGKTKEGAIARKIGIVLLCNERGYPLRWEVVSGTAHDSKTMLGMLHSIAGLRWVAEAPVVCDRAMGKTATIAQMSRLGLRFVTALTSTEFASYGGEKLPHEALATLTPSSLCDAKLEKEAAGIVATAGMDKVADNLFVKDLGIVEHTLGKPASQGQGTEAAAAAQAMKLCRRMLELVQNGESPSLTDAGHKLGLGKGVAAKYRGLQRLVEEIQRAVLAGDADGRTLDELLALARAEPAEQRRRFDELLATPRRRKGRARAAVANSPAAPPYVLKVHVVGYFNQERFVDKRYRANAQLDDVHTFVEDLNARLARTSGRRKPTQITAEVDRKLRRLDLLDVFAVTLHEDKLASRTQYRVEVSLDQTEWARRRRFDGFTLLVAHAELPHSAAELCRLYRAKDIVEKDFHVIKSVVDVRPIWHRDDPKVRAHVTLCMLALLLERTINHHLRGKYSAEAALECLEPCRLNQLHTGEQTLYGLTRPSAEQKDILGQLGLAKLVDDELVAERLHPR